MSDEKTDLLKQSIGQGCHDVRSPLTAVYGFAKLLERSELDEKSKMYLEQVVSGAERMDKLIEQLSELGRIAAGRSVPELETAPLSSFDVEEKANFTEGAKLTVQADRQWLGKVFNDLFEEQAKLSPEKLEVSAKATGDNIEIMFAVGEGDMLTSLVPEKSPLPISLAQMRLLGMDGSLKEVDGGFLITLPKGN
jgi:signal transduction histidine kinase